MRSAPILQLPGLWVHILFIPTRRIIFTMINMSGVQDVCDGTVIIISGTWKPSRIYSRLSNDLTFGCTPTHIVVKAMNWIRALKTLLNSPSPPLKKKKKNRNGDLMKNTVEQHCIIVDHETFRGFKFPTTLLLPILCSIFTVRVKYRWNPSMKMGCKLKLPKGSYSTQIQYACALFFFLS